LEEDGGVVYKSAGELGKKTEPSESGEGGRGQASGDEAVREQDACRAGICEGEEDRCDRNGIWPGEEDRCDRNGIWAGEEDRCDRNGILEGEEDRCDRRGIGEIDRKLKCFGGSFLFR